MHLDLIAVTYLSKISIICLSSRYIYPHHYHANLPHSWIPCFCLWRANKEESLVPLHTFNSISCHNSGQNNHIKSFYFLYKIQIADMVNLFLATKEDVHLVQSNNNASNFMASYSSFTLHNYVKTQSSSTTTSDGLTTNEHIPHHVIKYLKKYVC